MRFIATSGSSSKGLSTLRISGEGIKGSRILWMSARGAAGRDKSETIDALVWAPSKDSAGDSLIAFSTHTIRYGSVTQPDNLYVFSAAAGRLKLKVHFGLRWTQIIRFSSDARLVATIAPATPGDTSHGLEKLVLYDTAAGSVARTVYDSELTSNATQTIQDFAFVSNRSLDITIEGEDRRILHIHRSL